MNWKYSKDEKKSLVQFRLKLCNWGSGETFYLLRRGSCCKTRTFISTLFANLLLRSPPSCAFHILWLFSSDAKNYCIIFVLLGLPFIRPIYQSGCLFKIVGTKGLLSLPYSMNFRETLLRFLQRNISGCSDPTLFFTEKAQQNFLDWKPPPPSEVFRKFIEFGSRSLPLCPQPFLRFQAILAINIGFLFSFYTETLILAPLQNFSVTLFLDTFPKDKVCVVEEQRI